MIQHKPGVRLIGVHPLVLHAVYVADPIWMAAGAPATVITAGTDGTHMASSDHYRGLAVDLRTNTLAPEKAKRAITDLQAALGPDYYLLYENEGTANAHLHLAWRPQEGY